MDLLSASQLRFKCRRGMLELDIILKRFLERGYENTSETEKQQFEEMLKLHDPELNLLITGVIAPPAELKSLLSKIVAQ